MPRKHPALVGARALDGALARVSPHDNRVSLPADDAAAGPIGWGQWPDWDNGHADGGYAGEIVAAAGDRVLVTAG